MSLVENLTCMTNVTNVTNVTESDLEICGPVLSDTEWVVVREYR